MYLYLSMRLSFYAAYGYKQTLYFRDLPAGYTLSEVRPHHASLVDSTWAFGGTATSKAKIKYQIERLPSACVYNDKGEPVCWIISHFNGSGSIGRIKGFINIKYVEQ